MSCSPRREMELEIRRMAVQSLSAQFAELQDRLDVLEAERAELISRRIQLADDLASARKAVSSLALCAEGPAINGPASSGPIEEPDRSLPGRNRGQGGGGT